MDEGGQRGFQRAGLDVDVDCCSRVDALEHVIGEASGVEACSVHTPRANTMWMCRK